MVRIVFTLLFSIFISACANSQDKAKPQLVGSCEGCEAIFEYGNKLLSAVDTLPDFNDSGSKIKLTGKVFEQDGRTPAKDVIIYIYHTNQSGVYPTQGNEKGWARRHGYIRGWAKTDTQGRYTFYTLKPAAYPSRSEPAHIHYTVLEPNGRYYWLGSVHFMGDSLLTEVQTNPANPRGGSNGMVNLKKSDELWLGSRDIILGKNIPGY